MEVEKWVYLQDVFPRNCQKQTLNHDHGRNGRFFFGFVAWVILLILSTWIVLVKVICLILLVWDSATFASLFGRTYVQWLFFGSRKRW